MNHEEYLSNWFDRRLRNWQADTRYDIASNLDLDAGLSEIRIASVHADLAKDVATVLDVDAGLAAIVPSAWLPGNSLDLVGDVAPFETSLGVYTARFVLRPHAERLLARAWLPLPRLPELRLLADFTARAYDFAREVDSGEDLDRSHVRDFGRAVERAHDQGLALPIRYECVVNGVYALASSPVGVYEIVKAFSVALRWALADALHHSHKMERGFVIAATRDSECTPVYARAHELGRVIRLLEEAITSMAGADFSDVNLRGIPLEGVRWTDDTRWPEHWADRIRGDSVPIGPGIWEVRAGGAGTDLSTGTPVCRP